MEGQWLRVCVDVEQDGNASGWSVERYEDFAHTGTYVRPTTEGLTAEEAFQVALSEGVAHWGVQHPLPFP